MTLTSPKGANEPQVRYVDVARSVDSVKAQRRRTPTANGSVQSSSAVISQELPSIGSAAAMDCSLDSVEAGDTGSLSVLQKRMDALQAEQHTAQENIRRLNGSLAENLRVKWQSTRRIESCQEKGKALRQRAVVLEDKIKDISSELSPAPKGSPSSRPGSSGEQLGATIDERSCLSGALMGSVRFVNKHKSTGTLLPAAAVSSPQSRGAARPKSVSNSASMPHIDGAQAEAQQTPAAVASDAGLQRRSRAGVSTAGSSRSGLRGTTQPQSPKQEPEVNPAVHHDKYRKIIRAQLVDQAGHAKMAFRLLDHNASGQVSCGDFAPGVAALGVNWQDLTGFRKPRELFALFDRDKDGVVTFQELFPDYTPEEQRVSTPEFWEQYCWRTRYSDLRRGPSWLPADADSELEMHIGSLDQDQESLMHKKEMKLMIRRLKSRGRSDAFCREICAKHLPKGAGPPDLQDVPTLTFEQGFGCRKSYNDAVNETGRGIEKTLASMREQRKTLSNFRIKLQDLTLERARASLEDAPR
eukprot:TRINITY_DN17997_c0_g1_i1.p1 TRINITY_DN17997_c0_g1~~TRINITY_DN17997_c0_g1_i1.p1  ORF type:complete len:526 (+),score=125.61 TRINITY_DN17997_c0_g1_i1:111-1688(+)